MSSVRYELVFYIPLDDVLHRILRLRSVPSLQYTAVKPVYGRELGNTEKCVMKLQ
jgi:hypothetical protein